jgi:tryptophan-rich sensory protein
LGEIASAGQLRMSYLRWAIVTVPLILFLGFLSGWLAQSGEENAWYAALAKPDLTPPGWLFPVAWTSLYVLLGLAIAMILNARGARLRGVGIALFVMQMVLNLAWTPLFFGAHQVTAAFWLIVFMLGISIATTLVFARMRKAAAWLMVPYMVWISFAGMLTLGIDRLNPNAETLVPARARTKILL